MATETQVAPEQQALNEMRALAATPEEHAYLDGEQQQLDAERDQILSHRVGEVVIGADGVVVDKSTVEKEITAGHDMSGTYANGRRA